MGFPLKKAHPVDQKYDALLAEVKRLNLDLTKANEWISNAKRYIYLCSFCGHKMYPTHRKTLISTGEVRQTYRCKHCNKTELHYQNAVTKDWSVEIRKKGPQSKYVQTRAKTKTKEKIQCHLATRCTVLTCSEYDASLCPKDVSDCHILLSEFGFTGD